MRKRQEEGRGGRKEEGGKRKRVQGEEERGKEKEGEGEMGRLRGTNINNKIRQTVDPLYWRHL